MTLPRIIPCETRLEDCPECGTKYKSTCKCMQGDRFCGNGHQWFTCSRCKHVTVDGTKGGNHAVCANPACGKTATPGSVFAPAAGFAPGSGSVFARAAPGAAPASSTTSASSGTTITTTATITQRDGIMTISFPMPMDTSD